MPELFKNSTTDDYIRRHLGNTEADTKEMLKTMGMTNVDQLIDETIPDAIRLNKQE